MNKKFNLGSVILSVICVVFVAEAAAPVAAIGNNQFFWWLFMIIAFLLPYGLISSELGTTYQGEGGLYDWIHQAFPGTFKEFEILKLLMATPNVALTKEEIIVKVWGRIRIRELHAL